MNLKSIPPIHSPEKLVEIAFRRASKEARKVQVKNKGLRKKRAEERRVKESTAYITTYLSRVEKLRRRIDDATPFQRELLEITAGIENIEKALDEIAFVRKTLLRLQKRTSRSIRMSQGDPVALRKDFYGKTASRLKKIKRELEFIKSTTGSMKDYPTIKEGFTTVIAGMPNVGKSSLLRQITTSTPDVKPYPFTTKSILVGYAGPDHSPIQIIDTPGILDRPIAERNRIERQAILALKQLANLTLFIFDPTETCGFTLQSQIELYKELKNNFGEIIPVINKIDAADTSAIEKVEKHINRTALKCSARDGTVSEVYDFILNFQGKESTQGLQQENSYPRL